MREEFENFLTTNYCDSDLDAYVHEIKYAVKIRIELYHQLLNDYKVGFQTSIETFEEVFPNSDDEILVFISCWENYIPDFVEECFREVSDSFEWISISTDSDCERLKKIIRVKRDNIDYHQLIGIILNCEVHVQPSHNIRIYFFNEVEGQVYYNWDSIMEIGYGE